MPFDILPKPLTVASAESGVRDRDLERSIGAARVGFTTRNGSLQLADLYQSAPGRVLIPRVDGRDCGECVFVNTSGGVAGGDCLSYEVELQGPSTLLATTQAAEKIYRALDSPARLSTIVSVGAGATVFWLPQQTILFDRTKLIRSTDLNLETGAQIVALDWMVLGRAAHSEQLKNADIIDSWRLSVDGNLQWADQFRLVGDVAPQIEHPALLGGNCALATIVAVISETEGLLERFREFAANQLSEIRAGVSFVEPVVHMRLAARSGPALLDAVRAILSLFEQVCGQHVTLPPRVWAS